jgi:hypothetical protein
MSFPTVHGIPYGYEKKTATAAKNRLGALGMTPDGRIWAYSKAGAVALTPGLFCTFITTAVNEQTVTVAHAAGTTEVTVTAAGATADQFKDGYLMVSAGAGAGEVYRIRSNTAAVANLTTITLWDNDGLVTAWNTGTTDVNVYPNPYNGVIVCPTDGQQHAVCLPQGPVAIGGFFWGLVKGPGSFMVDNAAAAAGLELDEKIILQSLNHAGQGFIDTAPDATKILAAHRQKLGYLMEELDTTDNEMALGMIDLL